MEVVVKCRLQRPYETPWHTLPLGRGAPGVDMSFGDLLERVCSALGVPRADPDEWPFILRECFLCCAVHSTEELQRVFLRAASKRQESAGASAVELHFTVVPRDHAVCEAPMCQRDTVRVLCSAFLDASAAAAAHADSHSVVVVSPAGRVSRWRYRELLSYPGTRDPDGAIPIGYLRHVAAATHALRFTHVTVFWQGACITTTCCLDDWRAVRWDQLCDEPEDAAVARIGAMLALPAATDGPEELALLARDAVAGVQKRLRAQPVERVWAALLAMTRQHALPALGHPLPACYATDPACTLPEDYFPPFTKQHKPTKSKQQQQQQRLCSVANALAKLVATEPEAELPAQWCADNMEVFGAETACGLTLLHCAALHNRGQWLRELLRWCRTQDVVLDARGGNCGLTALAIAAQRGNLEALRACWQAGADPDATTGVPGGRDEGATALFLAAREGRVDACAYLLLACHADPTIACADGTTPLSVARVPAIARLLLSHGAKASALVTPRGGNALWAGDSSDSSSVELLQLYLKHGGAALVNTKGASTGATPLSLICGPHGSRSARAVECAKLLLAHGADTRCTDRDGATPLQALLAAPWCVSESDHTAELAEALLGAEPDALKGAAKSRGRAVLQPALVVQQCCEKRDWRTLEVFVRHGMRLTKGLKAAIRSAAQQAGQKEAGEAIIKQEEQCAEEERKREEQCIRELDSIAKELGGGKPVRSKRRARTKHVPAYFVDDDDDDDKGEGDGKDAGKEEEKTRRKSGKDMLLTLPQGTMCAVATTTARQARREDDDAGGWFKANERRPKATPAAAQKKLKKQRPQQQPQSKPATQQQRPPQAPQPSTTPAAEEEQQQQRQEQKEQEEDQHSECKRQIEELERRCREMGQRCKELEEQLVLGEVRQRELQQRIDELEAKKQQQQQQQQQHEQGAAPTPWNIFDTLHLFDSAVDHEPPPPSPQPQQEQERRGGRRRAKGPPSQPSAAARAAAYTISTLLGDD